MRVSVVAEALAVGPGSLRVMALRWIGLTASALPAFITAHRTIAAEVGIVPEIAAAGRDGGPPQVGHLLVALKALPPAFYGAAGAGILLFLLFEQLLTGAALTLFAPGRDGPVRVWATVWREGWRTVPPFLRVSALALVWALAGIGTIQLGRGALADHAEVTGWSGTANLIALPSAAAALTMVWLAAVGAVALWCRVLIIADGRRRVRRIALHVTRLAWRAPLSTLGFIVATSVSVQALGALLLTVQAPRGGGGGQWAPWLLYLALQVFAWHACLRAACHLYEDERFADLRTGSDEPFGIVAWARERLFPGQRERGASPQARMLD